VEGRDGNHEPDRADGPTRAQRLRDTARRADARPQLVATARFIRRLLPGDTRYGDALSTSGQRMPERIGRLVSDPDAERPSALRELGLGALQAWQALA
jgi:adenylate cyclase